MSFQPDAFQDDAFQIWAGSVVYTLQWHIQAMPRRFDAQSSNRNRVTQAMPRRFDAQSSNRNRVTQAMPRSWQAQADKHV